MTEQAKVRMAWVAIALIVIATVFVVRPRPSADVVEQTNHPVDLTVYPSVWTVTKRSSGSNLIAVRGRDGFSGPVTLTVSGLPSGVLDRWPTQSEREAGTGGYYCSSHCVAASNADFPMALTVADGQWTSIGPTLMLATSSQSETRTVTITATANGQSVSRSFTLKVVNDEFSIDETGPHQSATADPDVVATVNNASWDKELYKLSVAAGSSLTRQIDVKNDSSESKTVTLLSNLGNSGLSGQTTELTGGPTATTLTLAGNERRAVDVVVSPSAATPPGQYEAVFGVEQADGSNRASVGFAIQVTGSTSSSATSSSSSSTPTASSSSSPSTTSSSRSSTTSESSTTTSSSESASSSSTTSNQASSTERDTVATLSDGSQGGATTAQSSTKKTTSSSQSTSTSTRSQEPPVETTTTTLATAPDPIADTHVLTNTVHVVTLTGRVLDQAGEPIPGALVWLGDRRVRSNADGQFLAPHQAVAANAEALPESISLSVTHPNYADHSEQVPLTRDQSSTQIVKDIALVARDGAPTLSVSQAAAGTPTTVTASHFPASSTLHFFWNPFYTIRDTNPDGSQPITQTGLDGGKGYQGEQLVEIPTLTVDATGNGTVQLPTPGLPGTYTLLATDTVEPTVPLDPVGPGNPGYAQGRTDPAGTGFLPGLGTASVRVTVGGGAVSGASPYTDGVAQKFFKSPLSALTSAQRAVVQNFFAPLPVTSTVSRISGEPRVTTASVTTNAGGTTATNEHLVGQALPKRQFYRLNSPAEFTVTVSATDGSSKRYHYTSADPLPHPTELNRRIEQLVADALAAGSAVTVAVTGTDQPKNVTIGAASQVANFSGDFLNGATELAYQIGDRVVSSKQYVQTLQGIYLAVSTAVERAKETVEELERVQNSGLLPYHVPVSGSIGWRNVSGRYAVVRLFSEERDPAVLRRLQARDRCRQHSINDVHYGVSYEGNGTDCVVMYWNEFRVMADPSTWPTGTPPVLAGNGGVVYITQQSLADRYRMNREDGAGLRAQVETWYETTRREQVATLEARLTAARSEVESAQLRARELNWSITTIRGATSAPLGHREDELVPSVSAAEEDQATPSIDEVRETNSVRVRYAGPAATLSVTDPLGRTVGINPLDGSRFEQLVGATETGNGTSTSELFLPSVVEGEYTVTVTGSAAGRGTVTVETAVGVNEPVLSSSTVELAPGETRTLTSRVAFTTERTASVWDDVVYVITSVLHWWLVSLVAILGLGVVMFRSRMRTAL